MTPKAKELLERNPEARARLLATNIVYLNLGGLLPARQKAIAQIVEALPGRTQAATGEWIEIPEPPSAILVEWGRVHLVMPFHSGGIPAKTVGAGAVFGNVPLLGLEMAGAKAIAAEDCQIVVIDYPSLRAIIGSSRAITLRVMEMIGQRMIELTAECGGDIDSRLMRLISRLAGDDGEVYGIGSRDLAVVLGVSRQTVSEALGRLRGRGLIETSRMRVRVMGVGE